MLKKKKKTTRKKPSTRKAAPKRKATPSAIRRKTYTPRKKRRQPASPIRTVATAGVALYGAGTAFKMAGRLL